MTGHQILVVAGLIALLIAATAWRKFYYSSRRRFRSGDETFIWVPDGEMNWNPFARDYGGGYFLYKDESPVTDELLIEGLRERWNWLNRPRGF